MAAVAAVGVLVAALAIAAASAVGARDEPAGTVAPTAPASAVTDTPPAGEDTAPAPAVTAAPPAGVVTEAAPAGAVAPTAPASAVTDTAPAGVVTATAGSPDWRAVLRGLDRARSRALTAGDATLLAEADLAGSPALTADRALLAAFAAAGVSPEGFGLQIVSVRETARDGASVRLHVVDRRSAYRLIDRAGSVVGTRPARGESRWEVTVVPDATGEWRVRSVTSLPG